MKWNPIETEPRNGRMVMYWSNKHGFRVGNHPPGCMAGLWEKVNGQWVGCGNSELEEMTHWRNLPKEPEEA